MWRCGVFGIAFAVVGMTSWCGEDSAKFACYISCRSSAAVKTFSSSDWAKLDDCVLAINIDIVVLGCVWRFGRALLSDSAVNEGVCVVVWGCHKLNNKSNLMS